LAVVLLGALTVRVVWWTVAPLVPYLVSAFVIVTVVGFVYYRMTRW
jgi:membrane protein YdbS with pleckstrin-like domain